MRNIFLYSGFLCKTFDITFFNCLFKGFKRPEFVHSRFRKKYFLTDIELTIDKTVQKFRLLINSVQVVERAMPKLKLKTKKNNSNILI